MDLSESLEDYLEAIFVLSETKKVVRVKDLMSHLDFKVSSVNNAVKSLTEKGLVEHEKYGHIELTEKGAVVAHKIYKKHINITRFFEEVLCVSKETANQSACRMEHILTGEAYGKFVNFLNFIIDSPALKEYTQRNDQEQI